MARILRSALPLALLLLSACGGNTNVVSGAGYTVGGTVSGLTGAVMLQNNDSSDLTEVKADGAFIFAGQQANSSPYNVSVFSQPAGQTCSVSTGAGTIAGGNVSNVVVVCSAATYTVAGSVSGLLGTVVLQVNNGDNLSVSANGAFTFATPVANGSPYSVSVLTQPSSSMSCMVANGSGTISANVSNVAVSCSKIKGGAIQGTPLALATAPATKVSTLAGALPGADGTGTFANFGSPGSVVSDGTNLYVADSNNQTIRQIVLATGATTTLAGTAGVWGSADGLGAAASFNNPAGITLAGGNLYVADMYNMNVRQVNIASGAVVTVAGTGGWGSTDGAGTAASFAYPAAITSDGVNLYVADTYNHKIRKIAPSAGATLTNMTAANAVVSTLAGGGYGIVNGLGYASSFIYPHAITTDGVNLYVSDAWNAQDIRQIAPPAGTALADMTSMNAVVTTLAGTGSNGSTDGAAAAATFGNVYGLASDGINLYVADADNNKIRQIVIATGAVSSFTGAANSAMATGAADGADATASFNSPQGISLSGGKLYVADSGNNTIRQITLASQTVNTVAGAVYGADGTGAAARFNYPGHTTTDGTNLYVADSSDYTIRKIVIATGEVSTLAGKAGEWGFVDGTGADARFGYPLGITTDGSNLYVTDTDNYNIRKVVIATGAVTTVAGSGNSGSRDGTGAMALFSSPTDITTDGTNLYVTDEGNHNVRQIVIATRVVTTLAGSGNPGAADGTGTAASFSSPGGITTDGTNLYVADRNNNKIRQIVIATGVVSSLTGAAETQVSWGAADGAGSSASFNYPSGITTDGSFLYVADSSNNKIRKVEIATRMVSSVTGTANTAVIWGATDGAGAVASFDYPYGISTDGISLFVSDDNNSTIRKIVEDLTPLY